MGALKCDDLRRRVRNLQVRFGHSHSANNERAGNNEECEIPSHRCSLPYSASKCTDSADMGVTAVTKHRFCLAPPRLRDGIFKIARAGPRILGGRSCSRLSRLRPSPALAAFRLPVRSLFAIYKCLMLQRWKGGRVV